MTQTFDVLSYGTVGLDYITHVPDWPSPEMGVHAPEETEHLGGKATNVAVFLGHWGVKVAVRGNVIGGDLVGERLLEILDGHPNVGTQYLVRDPDKRSMYCRILVNPEGERAIVGINVDRSLQAPVTPDIVETIRILTLDLYGGNERVNAARLAYEADCPVVVGDLRQADHPVLEYTKVAIASAAEVRRDYPTYTLAEFSGAVRQQGASQVIITDAAKEVCVFDLDGALTTFPPPSVDVVDSTGAGDAFRAGVTYGVLKGLPLIESARLGAAAGSLNVGRSGAASDPPSLDEVFALAKSIISQNR